MKKLLYISILFASSLFFAQKSTKAKFVICNDAVGTVEMFDVYKKEIVTKAFLKGEKLPQHLKKFSYLADQGLTEIKLKKDFGTPDILSIASLNEQHNLAKDTPVMIDGYELNDNTTNIYSEIIKKIEIKEDNGRKYLSVMTSDH